MNIDVLYTIILNMIRLILYDTTDNNDNDNDNTNDNTIHNDND